MEDLNWRELAVIAKHSRQGDALYRAAHGPAGAWSSERHALVDVAEAIDQLIWTVQAVQVPRGKALPPLPKPRPRPGSEPPKEKLTGDPLDKSEWAEFWRTGVHPNGPRGESGDGLRSDHPDR